MYFLKTSNKINILTVCIVLAATISANAQAKKNVLDRKTSVFVSGVLLDPFYDLYSTIKITPRIALGVDQKINYNTTLGVRLMRNKAKSYPWSIGQYEEPYSSLANNDSINTLHKIGYTIANGGELYVRRFRAKHNSYFPAGRYLEFGMGLQNTRFTGYSFTDQSYINSSYQNVLIVEPKRVIKTVSLSIKTGKQWIFDSHVFLGYGITCRLHVPISGLSQETQSDASMSATGLYLSEVLGTDIFSTFIHAGYLF